MIPAENLIPFVFSAIFLALAPGPDNLFVLTKSLTNGRRAGIAISLGLAAGLLFHTAAVALGIAAVVKASSVAFAALKLLGAGYLLYLAWGAWRAGGAELDIERGDKELSFSKLWLRGVVMNITNPKVTLFFLAFLPQFTDSARGSVAFQVVTLGLLFILSAIPVFITIAFMAEALRERLSANVQTGLNKVAAGVFVLLAGKLLTSKAN